MRPPQLGFGLLLYAGRAATSRRAYRAAQIEHGHIEAHGIDEFSACGPRCLADLGVREHLQGQALSPRRGSRADLQEEFTSWCDLSTDGTCALTGYARDPPCATPGRTLDAAWWRLQGAASRRMMVPKPGPDSTRHCPLVAVWRGASCWSYHDRGRCGHPGPARCCRCPGSPARSRRSRCTSADTITCEAPLCLMTLLTASRRMRVVCT